MEQINFSDLSNAEIKIKLKNYEDEYDVIKNKIASYASRMRELDKLYLKGKNELKKRRVL